MSQSQQSAHSPEPTASPSASSGSASTNDGKELSLAEMLRVLDVARELRQERESAEVALRRDEVRREIKRKLTASAKITGDTVSDAEIDAAIDQYFDSMHVLKEPPRGLQNFLAHVYVLRRRVAAGLIVFSLVIGSIWYLCLSPWAPFSPTVRAQRSAAAAVQRATTLHDQIVALSVDSEATAESNRLFQQIQASGPSNADLTGSSLQSMEGILRKLQVSYRIQICGGQDETSLLEREFNADDGQRLAGYYVVVRAVDENGDLVPQSIRNSETAKVKAVQTWAERIPQDVFDRLVADKQSDGVLNEVEFAIKRRGELSEQTLLSGKDGTIERQAQITDWE